MAIPRKHRGTANKWLSWTLLLLYTTSSVTAVSEPPIPASIIAIGSDPPSRNAKNTQAGRSPAEIPQLTHDVQPKFRNTNEDARNYGQALAPASLKPAVRAPASQSTESQALSQQDSARRLIDWEADDIILLATIDGALHARDRRSGRRRWELKMPEPMIQSFHYTQNRSDGETGQLENDYIFVVEPAGDGQLYAQFSDPRMGLKRLDATVKKMAAEVPFQMEMQGQWLAVNSQQESKTYTIDAQTGRVLFEFPRARSSIRSEPQPRCRPRSGLDFEDSACTPERTIRLGRNTYTFTISNERTGQDLCTIRFSEWATNKLDSDLQRQHLRSLDNYDILADHNGGFVGIDVTAEPDRRHRYHETLGSPIARVFDVARKVDEEEESNLLLLSRSSDFASTKEMALYRQDPMVNQRVFVNQTGLGNWFALSEQNYPGVTTKAKLANAARDWYTNSIDLEGDMKDIIGVHLLSKDNMVNQQLTISERPFTGNANELVTEPEKGMSDNSFEEEEGSMYAPKHSFWKRVGDQIWVVVITMALIFGVSWAFSHKDPEFINNIKRLARQDLKLRLVQADASPSVISPRKVESTIEMPIMEAVDNSTQIVEIVGTPAHSRVQSVVSVASLKKDKDENESEGESENENESNEGQDQKKKKKTKRGNRGGRGRRKNKSSDLAFEPRPILHTEKALRDGFVQVGEIVFDSRIENALGYGSNGTSVHPGTCMGRVVAVKRMVKTANSLAEKEIQHLENSDSHPNVIRFMGNAESSNFFFIALERFDTSLDRFVELPNEYPNMVDSTKGYDVKDALRQITLGLQHIHSLKLVHRDIKPQNILVKPVKTARPVEGHIPLLFVISDFGLCKPLEDGPASNFKATRTAAGTIGWKAPELLVPARDAIAAPLANTDSTQSTLSLTISNMSESGSVVDPPTGRRATKAIDIFALGCVFFYVKTRGGHPFDRGGSNIARELNIIEDKPDTSLLRESFTGYDFDGEDLILQMIMHDPKSRPDTRGILNHPYFWPAEKKLEFICAVSDAYEERKQSVTNIHDENAERTEAELSILEELAALQKKAPDVIGVRNKDGALRSFLDALPKSFLAEMGKQRKYTGTKMIDLLRVVRNKKNHYHSLPVEVQEMMQKSVVGSNGRSHVEGYYAFWRDRFPSLLVNCHQLLQERNLVGEFMLQGYYD